MIDKNIILDQQQPPLYQHKYIYKNEDYVRNACNTLVDRGNSKANGAKMNENKLTEIHNFLTNNTFDNTNFSGLPAEAAIDGTVMQNSVSVDKDSCWKGFETYLEAGNIRELCDKERWPEHTEAQTLNEKKCFYYLNYLNYCLQNAKKENGTTVYPSVSEYRLRINQPKTTWTFNLIGKFNVDIKSISFIEFKLYKQNIDNAIWSKKIAIDNNMNNILSENKTRLSYSFDNSNLNLKENGLYKIILKIYYENGLITQTNYGLIKCLNYELSPNIQQLNNKYKITSYDSPLSLLKITENYNGFSNNLNNQIDKYSTINLENLTKKQIQYHVPILNYGTKDKIIKREERDIYYQDQEDSKGNKIQHNFCFSSLDNNSTSIGKIYFLPNLEFSDDDKNQNCWLINKVRAANKYYNDGIYCYSSTLSDNNVTKSLIIPRKIFDLNKSYNNFNISFEQQQLFEKDNMSLFLNPSINIIGLKSGKVENDYDENNYFVKIATYLKNLFNTNDPAQGLNELTCGEIVFNTEFKIGDYDFQKDDLFVKNSKIYEIDNINNGEYTLSPINNNNNNSSIFYTPDPIEKQNFLTSYLGGVSINGEYYVPDDKLIQASEIMIPQEGTCVQNKNFRYSYDFQLDKNDDYIFLTFFTSDINHYESEDDYYNILQRVVSSIRIVPIEDNILNSSDFMIPQTPFTYYEYEDNLEFDDNISSIDIKARFANNETISYNCSFDQSSVGNNNSGLTINDTGGLQAVITQELDEGYINIKIKDNNASGEDYNFNLLRNNSIIYSFSGEQLKAKSPSSILPYLIYKDYGAEQGKTYKYYLQPVQNNILYKPILIDEILHDFYHLTLIDSTDSVVIKYNPKISTYKTITAVSKIDTLGSQYPFIRANGNNQYKQFQLSGLISIDMKPRENESIERYQTADSVDRVINNNNQTINDVLNADKVYLERLYKNQVLDWLNNNQPKLLKTATEGNFIVQLMNVSLTPMDQLGRMLHSFQCDAYEVMEYNQENIQKFHLYKDDFI